MGDDYWITSLHGVAYSNNDKGTGEVINTSARQKGKNFERELAKDIETRLGGRAWRTPCSGSLWWQKADVTCRDSIMTRFHIEAKRQEKWSLDTWYGQALRGAVQNQIPIVVAKRNRDVAMVYLRWTDFLEILELWQSVKIADEKQA